MSGYEPSMLSLDVEAGALASTRRAFHVLAERVLAPDLHRSTGRIGLRRTPGGFGQPEHVVDGARRRLRVDGTRLAVVEGDVERWVDVPTLGDACAAAGVDAEVELGVYATSTPSDPSTTLSIDPSAAQLVASWFALVDEAVEELRRRHAHLRPSITQLWPEHFDLACSMSEINFGGSPGDDGRPEPYLYVGPWTPRDGDFWNEPYGAARSCVEVSSVGDAVAFFEAGLAEALRP